MIPSTETLSQVAQINADRDARAADKNATQLLNWQLRHFRDVVSCPVPTNPPEWPAKRISIDAPVKVTRLPVRSRG